jgi:hypothetical protein
VRERECRPIVITVHHYLHSSAISDGLVRVDRLVELLAVEELGKHLLNL